MVRVRDKQISEEWMCFYQRAVGLIPNPLLAGY